MYKRILMFGLYIIQEEWLLIIFLLFLILVSRRNGNLIANYIYTITVYYQQLGSESFSTCQKCLCKVLSQSSQVNKQHFQTDWLSYIHWHKTLAAIIRNRHIFLIIRCKDTIKLTQLLGAILSIPFACHLYYNVSIMMNWIKMIWNTKKHCKLK